MDPRLFAGLLLAVAAAHGPRAQPPPPSLPPPAATSPLPRVAAVFTLPELPLQPFLELALHRVVADPHHVLLGGIGSDLWHAPDEPRERFWMLCDRGPNGQVTVDGAARRTFLIPDYTPLILHVEATGDRLAVLEVVPLTGRSGRPVTGLANRPRTDEVPFDAAGARQLACNESGLDTEGLVRLRNGEFWLADEYGPSLVHADAHGRVLERLVPAGVDLPQADYPVRATLPAVFARRKPNRGFEGLALTPDESTLFAALQSPLLVPDKAVGEASRQVRILGVDTRSGRPALECVYAFEPAAAFDPKATPAEMKIGAIAVRDDDTFLVVERTDAVARVFAASRRHASNLLGTAWDDPAHAPSLESLAEPTAAGVVPLHKRLVVDLTSLPGVPGKIEGLAILDAQTLAIANDNDFDVGAGAPGGPPRTPCRVWWIALPPP